MSAKHTPGPWHRNIRPASKYPTVWSGRNTHVAAICPGAPRGSGNGCTMSEEEQEANINLIAAAPDLLVAARKADQFLDHYKASFAGVCAHTQAMMDALKAAIAKAEGQSND